MHIIELEENARLPLVERIRRTLYLTEAGQELRVPSRGTPVIRDWQ